VGKGDIGVLGEGRLREIAEGVLRHATADQTEVLVTSGEADLTRFAVNTIHQNVTEKDVSVRVRVICRKRTGVASGNDVTDAGLLRLVQMAESAASFQKENPEFTSLPEPLPITSVDAFVAATADYTP
jgi:predicted Zn-dependent protease